MRLNYWLCFIVLICGLNACKKPGKISQRRIQYNEKGIPSYDSINWTKQFKFGKINKAEKNEKAEAISRFFNEQWLPSNASGGLLVAWHGEIIFEAYNGYSNYENDELITAETPVHIASVSKVLTGLAILKLVENNKIGLEDKVSQYLDGFPYDDVKIIDLLNHRSGLPNYLHLSDDKKFWNSTEMMTNQDVLNILIDKKPPPSWPSGKKFSYCNTNYVLLALIIEKLTKLSYPEAMKFMVFEPLGMTNTFVMEFDKDSAKVSKSYYNNGREWKYDHLDKTYGDKNIYSTPRDLLKMDVAMYSPKFLPEELKELAWKGYSYESKGIKNYGIGIRMLEWDNGDKLLYHKGLWHGNRSLYVRDFRDEVCVIALGNRINKSIYESMGLVSLFYNYPFPPPEKSAGDSLKTKVDSNNGQTIDEKALPEKSDANAAGTVENLD